MASKVNLEDPAFNPKNENPRAAKAPVKPSRVGNVPHDSKVMVQCVVENKPHAYVYEKDDDGNEMRRLRALDHWEKALIDLDVAEVLERNKHAIRL